MIRRCAATVAVVALCLLGACALLLASHAGEARRCDALPVGSLAWQTYCGDRR